MALRAILVGLEAFLLGSIPWGLWITRWSGAPDVRRHGSGNIGATNVLRVAGKRAGAVTLVLDAGKGYLAVWIALHASRSDVAGYWRCVALALALVVAGHVFTPWLGFHGGKGVATGLGAFLALAPAAALAALGVWIAVVAVCRYVSAASILASLSLPVLVHLMRGAAFPPAVYAAAALAAALIVWRHAANLRRLRAGTEPRLFGKAAA